MAFSNVCFCFPSFFFPLLYLLPHSSPPSNLNLKLKPTIVIIHITNKALPVLHHVICRIREMCVCLAVFYVSILPSIKQLDRYGQLILANSTAADTGEYSCWLLLCNGSSCKKDESKTGSTYIFFTDKGELFVPTSSYFEIVYLNPDKPAVIPCRVTIPSAKVTLHREFPAEEIKTDGTNIIYDVKKGFIYQHPTSDHKGVVYCRAESRGAPQISIKYQLLYVEVPSGPPSTTIVASSNKAEGGDNVNVLCIVLGEPDVEVEFNWKYPGEEYERPVIIQDSWRLINRGIGHTTRISKSVIAIEDFETIDAGNYICTAQNLRGQTTVATHVDLT
uniref:Platelet derived growth factor receptor like n=1 Tax=Terrapene triunguis TaxID=2587831 RepID=A0A674IPF2_9SAUR